MCPHGAWDPARTPDRPLRELPLSPVLSASNSPQFGPWPVSPMACSQKGWGRGTDVHGHFSDRQVGEALGYWTK